jgi:hypothetical protein
MTEKAPSPPPPPADDADEEYPVLRRCKRKLTGIETSTDAVLAHIFDAEAMFSSIAIHEDDNYCISRGEVEELMEALVRRNAQPGKTKIDISFSAGLEAPGSDNENDAGVVAGGSAMKRSPRCPDLTFHFSLSAAADDVLDADGVAELLKFMTPHAYDVDQMEQVIENIVSEKKLLTIMSRDRQKRKRTQE